jgi:hypothetical protein
MQISADLLLGIVDNNQTPPLSVSAIPGESADWPTSALASSDEGSDMVRVGLPLFEAARSLCRGGGEGFLNRDHEGRFLKGDLCLPGKAATRHEGDPWVVWVGSWDKEVGKG